MVQSMVGYSRYLLQIVLFLQTIFQGRKMLWFCWCPEKRGWPALILYKHRDCINHRCCLTPTTIFLISVLFYKYAHDGAMKEYVVIFIRMNLWNLVSTVVVSKSWSVLPDFKLFRVIQQMSVCSEPFCIESCTKMSTHSQVSLSL